VIDAFARRIVGWRVSRTAQASFVLDALDQALHDRRPVKGVVHHSDRGVQYVSIKYTERLTGAGVEPAALATASTTPWLRRSTASTRPR
jgi:transposase InsO family protein